MAAKNKLRQYADAQVVLDHGQDREIRAGGILDIRLYSGGLQDSVDIIAVSILRADERRIFKPFDGNFVILGKGVAFRYHGHHRIVADRDELVRLMLVITDEPNIYLVVLYPVDQIAFMALADLKTNAGVLFLELLDDLGNPVYGTADIGSDGQGTFLCSLEEGYLLIQRLVG